MQANVEPPTELPVALLKRLELNSPKPYYTLLGDTKLVNLAGSIDNLTMELYRLIAQGFAELSTHVGESYTDEILVSLTEMGKSFVEMNTRRKG